MGAVAQQGNRAIELDGTLTVLQVSESPAPNLVLQAPSSLHPKVLGSEPEVWPWVAVRFLEPFCPGILNV